MPFFMIGTQRSGSNLLRLMIDQTGDVVAPHPPHIMERLGPLEAHYGDLHRQDQFEQLVEDVCQLVEKNPVTWDGVELHRGEVRKRCRDHSLVAVYGAVHDMLAESRGARAWCCKSLANVHYLPEIERYFGDQARYVHLYRDGRDVALSFRKAIVGEKTWYHIAKQWHEEQQQALSFKPQVPADRFISVSYESLTTNPEPVLRRLCDFMGVDYRDSMLDFHKSKEANRTAVAGAMWANVKEPVKANNSNKFLREASEQEIRIFESVAGSSLDALSYPRAFVKPGEESRFDELTLAGFEAENRRLKEEARARTDPEDLKLRKPQAELLKAINQRLVGTAQAA